jgi:hypothetical protein
MPAAPLIAGCRQLTFPPPSAASQLPMPCVPEFCSRSLQAADIDGMARPSLTCMLFVCCCCCTDRCLASLGRFKELAPRLLDRLLMAAVVAQPAAVLEGYAGALTAFVLCSLSMCCWFCDCQEYTDILAPQALVNALSTILAQVYIMSRPCSACRLAPL